MTTVNDVKPDVFITALKEELKKVEQIQPPEWTIYAKTGVSRERSPTQEDWWFIRSASILRKIYIKGTIGTQKLRVIYGSAKNRGVRPSRFKKASGAVIRNILKQLEESGLVERNGNKGRSVSAKGRSMMDNLAHSLKE